jgi:hypothetical protein
MPMIIGDNKTGKKTAFFKNFVPGIFVSIISAPKKPKRFRVTVVRTTKILVFIRDLKKTLSLKSSI